MVELKQVLNVNIFESHPLITPLSMKRLSPISKKILKHVYQSRETVKNILDGKDPRTILIVGPCSIHDTKAALDYARRLKKIAQKIQDTFFVIMRVYFEKPRTAIGWKGLINDPLMNDSFLIEQGLKRARKLLIQINEMGLPAGTEALDPITPQYLAELITWSAIGARTIESQTHRELSSGLSMPVGFKNATNGGIEVALNALRSTRRSHHFQGINEQGVVSVFSTCGNRYGHLVLRGGIDRPNYDKRSVAKCLRALKRLGLREKIIIDCSHSNSRRDHTRQPLVFRDCMQQILDGNKRIVGLMLESHLKAGRQDLPANPKKLKYGVSVTDACLDWKTTEKIIGEAYQQAQKTLKKHNVPPARSTRAQRSQKKPQSN